MRLLHTLSSTKRVHRSEFIGPAAFREDKSLDAKDRYENKRNDSSDFGISNTFEDVSEDVAHISRYAM
jgi:hypothetical protein